MSTTFENITEEQMALLKIVGYSEKSIKYYTEHVNLGTIEYPDIRHIEIGECGDIIILYINLCEGPSIQKIKFKYVGCPALAASGASMTKLVTGKKISEAFKISEKDILADLESIPEDHHHCPVLAINALKFALKKSMTKKMLTQEEHDEYIHPCGLSGKEIDERPPIECEKCNMVKKCEEDHMILRNC